MRNKVMRFLFCLTLGVCGVTPCVFADYAKNDKWYAGVSFIRNSLGGDFNGQAAFVGSNEAIFVPKVSDGQGWEILLGGRTDKLALEFGYIRSFHDATILGVTSSADYTIFDFNFKQHFRNEKQFQPYWLGGFNLPYLNVKNAMITSGLSVKSTTFAGWGLNLGGGAAYYFTPQVALDGGIIYRYTKFDQARAADGKYADLNSALESNALCFTLGVTYAF